MPLNIIDYSRAPLVESPFSNILENVLRGYQIGEAPRAMKEELNAKQLANQLRQMDIQSRPQQYALDTKAKELANAMHEKALGHIDRQYNLEDAYKKSLIDRANRMQVNTPSQLKISGEFANWKAGHPDASPEELKKVSQELYDLYTGHKKAVTNRAEDLTSGSSFDKLPTNDKKREIGLMTAMGVDPVTATSMLRQGTSATQYAQDHGIDITQVTPKYPLGEQNIKDVQRTKAYFKELESLENNISEGLAEYPNRLKGYSFKQIADMLAGDKPDKVGKALASAALSPELASLRLKVQGGNVGIEAIKELTNKSFGDLKTVKSLVDRPTYLAMQKYITQFLNEAGNIRLRNLEDYGKLQGALNKQNESSGKKTFDFSAYPVSGAK